MGKDQIEQGGGNKQPPLLSEYTTCSFQAINWVMTYNNYPKDIFDQIEQVLIPLCSKYVFGKEIGEEGTPHIQGAFILKKKKRQGEIYNLFKAKFYLDKMKGKWAHQSYCTKELGDKLTNVIFKAEKRPKKILKFEQLNAWELKIDHICRNEQADDRPIMWFFSKMGNVGKTTFCKYLHLTYDCCVIGGKATDSKHRIASYIDKSEDKRAPEIVICPIPRSLDENFFSYEGLESIKDMFFNSGKYEGLEVNDNAPHMFVFANQPPEFAKCSPDRWDVFEITDSEGNYKKYNGYEFLSTTDED